MNMSLIHISFSIESHLKMPISTANGSPNHVDRRARNISQLNSNGGSTSRANSMFNEKDILVLKIAHAVGLDPDYESVKVNPFFLSYTKTNQVYHQLNNQFNEKYSNRTNLFFGLVSFN